MRFPHKKRKHIRCHYCGIETAIMKGALIPHQYEGKECEGSGDKKSDLLRHNRNMRRLFNRTNP